MREFIDEMTVLGRWLGRDLALDLAGVVPVWNAFRFRDAAVFELEPDVSGCADRMYLVRGASVREFVVSEVTIDEVYADLGAGGALPAVA